MGWEVSIIEWLQKNLGGFCSAIILFVILGLFPKMFPLFEKIGGKKGK